MLSSTFASAVAAVVLASTALVHAETPSSVVVSIASPTVTVTPRTPTQIGCFSSSEPLENHGSAEFQSDGNCQRICVMLDKAVFAMVDGTDCWCGDKIPVATSQVGNSSCSTPCNGFPDVNCGGDRMWWVALSGTTRNKVLNFQPGSSSSSTSSSKTAAASQVSEAVSTAVVTEIPTETPKAKTSAPNKTAIAVGVVVGVVGLAAIIAGVMLFLRHQRRRQVEEEYRRQAAASSFVAGGKLHTSNSSMTDSRLDPEFMARRASNGSIADNEDYSRRILKVTNPDEH